jgi:hypothetical protein
MDVSGPVSRWNTNSLAIGIDPDGSTPLLTNLSSEYDSKPVPSTCQITTCFGISILMLYSRLLLRLSNGRFQNVSPPKFCMHVLSPPPIVSLVSLSYVQFRSLARRFVT